MTICVTDLDGTLVFIADPDPNLCVVERFPSGRVARIHRETLRGWQLLASSGQLIVSTSRTVEQFQRADLPVTPYVLASNGLDLIVDGRVDQEWHQERRNLLGARAEPWSRIRAHLGQGIQDPALRATVIDDYFVVMVGTREAVLAGAEQLSTRLCSTSWRAVAVGRKLYLLPVELDKYHALAALLRRLQHGTYLAAGDSPMDLALLRHANLCIVPKGAHLENAKLENLTVTPATGPLAGRDIVAWFQTALATGL